MFIDHLWRSFVKIFRFIDLLWSYYFSIVFSFSNSLSVFFLLICTSFCQFSSVTQVMSNSLRPHGLQHTRLSCPSPTPRACSNSCPLSWWYHPTSSSSVVPFSSRLPSFPASGSFPMNQLFTRGGQSIGASASVSASVLPMYIQDWFPLGLTGLISLQSKGLESPPTPQFKSINSSVLIFGIHCGVFCTYFLFSIFPQPRPSAVCLFALFLQLIWWRQTFFISIRPVYLLCMVCGGGGGAFGALADISSCL